MTNTKIGTDGKPFDPAGLARHAHSRLRAFVAGISDDEGMSSEESKELSDALNIIGDRLCTCDALEAKVSRLREARDEAVRLLRATGVGVALEHIERIAKVGLLLALLLAGCGRERAPLEVHLPAAPSSAECPLPGDVAVHVIGDCFCAPSSTECAK